MMFGWAALVRDGWRNNPTHSSTNEQKTKTTNLDRKDFLMMFSLFNNFNS